MSTDYPVRFVDAAPGIPEKSQVRIDIVDDKVLRRQMVLTVDKADELARAITALLRTDFAILRYGDHAINKDGAEVALTRQEADLMAMCARYPGHVLTYETIAAKLWPEDSRRDMISNPRVSIHVVMCRVNEKCRDMGLSLSTVYDLGVKFTGNLSIDWRVR